MTTKLKFLWVLLAMLVGGVNGAWGETYELQLNDKAYYRTGGTGDYSTTATFFTVSGTDYNTRYTGSYDGVSYTRGFKMTSSSSVSFTPNNIAIVTIVQCTKNNNDDCNETINFDGNILPINTADEGGTNCRVYTIRNVSANNVHSITRGSGESGLFYIKVQETGALSGFDYTVKTYPYTWNFNSISDCESEFISYSDWAGRSGSKPDANGVYVRQTPSDYSDSDYPMGYDITALKGLRFSKDGYIAPDCNYNYLYVTSMPTITIPSVPVGSFVSVVGTSRDENTRTIAGTNTTPASQTSKDGPFVFKASSTGDVALELQNGDYNLHSIEVVEDDLERYSSLPYEWRFSDANWWVTKSEWLNSWDKSTNSNGAVYAYQIPNINNNNYSESNLFTGVEMPEANNLTFKAVSGRVGVVPGNYLWLNADASVKLPTLPAQSKVTVRARSQYSSNPTALITTNTTDLTSKDVNGTVTDYVFTVADNGVVTLTNGSHAMLIYNIKVEKAEYSFSEYQTTYYDGVATTATKTVAYKADGYHKFSIGANVPIGVSISQGDFTVTSSNVSVIDVSSWGYDASDFSNGHIWFNNLVTGNAGTSVLTFTFNGNSSYASKSFVVSVTVTKADPVFIFTNSDKGADPRNYLDASASSFTKSMTVSTGVTGIVYTSSDTHVATINASTGEITVHNSGSTTIRAKYAGNDNYNSAETFCYLIINGSYTTSTTLTWDTDPDSNHSGTDDDTNKKVVEVAFGTNEFSYTATASPSTTVKYKSSNTDVATVSSDGTVTLVRQGEAWINAYIDGNGDTNGKELKYYLKVTGGALAISFSPSSGTVSPGCVIMPRLVIPTIEKDNIGYLTIESSNTAVATVPSSNLLTQSESLTMQGTRINGVHPIINGVANGTATITVKFQSPYYNNGVEQTATYVVTVQSDQTGTTWLKTKREYTITTGEYMMMPSISGNFNGNINGLSKGTVCLARHGYVYSIMGASRTITWNNADYYLGEGVPDYTLIPASIGGGEGYIYWSSGNDASHPALMIYGESAGDLILRATDSQTGYSIDDITIHVVDKTKNVTDMDEDFWADKKFPFTWDFTNIAPADITDDDVHWRTYGFHETDPYGVTAATGEHYLGMPASFNYDYSDEDQNGVGYQQGNYQMLKKYITNGEGDNCKIMPAFYGLRLNLGNNSSGSYWAKRDRVILYDNSSSNPCLYLEGGQHILYLPAMGSDSRPSQSYRLYMKVRGHNSDSKVAVYLSGENDDNFTYTGTTLSCPTSAGCIYYDISTANAGKKIGLGFENNVDIYWIALSTEAKPVTQPTNTTYPAATYSYQEALDIDKSEEANSGLTTYYASSFTEGNVVMSRIHGKVESGTNSGLMLKLPDGQSTSCYMIVDSKNTEQYIAPQTFTENESNLLKSTGTGMTISRFGANEGYTNFVLTNQYIEVDDNDPNFAETGEQGGQNWGFVRVNGSIEAPANMAYLILGGRQGNIGTTFDESASRSMYGIVFEDDSELTGIKNLHDNKIQADEDAWFTLQGVRVATPSKGRMYIHKGKKVFLK